MHLKALKVEIEHLQLLMEKAKVKLQKEFEDWWAEEATRLQVLIMVFLGSHRPLPPCDLETLKAVGEGQTPNPLEQQWGGGTCRPMFSQPLIPSKFSEKGRQMVRGSCSLARWPYT